MKDILWFKDIGKNDVGVVGGKGANLGELFNNNIPVPNGFCVTAQTYEKFIKSVGIKDEINFILAKLNIEDTKQLDRASKKIQKLILAKEIPADIKDEVSAAYNVLLEEGFEFVAVRSSATAEDLPEASFAGQQDTYLNVRSVENVIRDVQRCWASLFTPRAIFYREKNNFEHEDVLIAVVIQVMVDADKAGVMFTVNPVTNNREEMVIEGVYGLGESLVSGSITPDSYMVDKKNGVSNQKHINNQEWGLFKKDGKTEKVDIFHGEEEVLNPEEIMELTSIGRLIEDHYDFPQDIEWAFKDKIYILQSRPITTLK